MSMACVCQWIEACILAKGVASRHGVLQTERLVRAVMHILRVVHFSCQSLAEYFHELLFELQSSRLFTCILGY